MIYRFDEFELDTDRFELRRGGIPQKVEPQVFGLLELLVANHERMVSKDELNLQIWGGRVVSEAVVNSRIRSARRAIGDDGKTQRLIKTVHNRGFRFVGAPTANTAGAAANRWCIHVMAPTAMTKAEMEPTAGHGLGSTRW